MVAAINGLPIRNVRVTKNQLLPLLHGRHGPKHAAITWNAQDFPDIDARSMPFVQERPLVGDVAFLGVSPLSNKRGVHAIPRAGGVRPNCERGTVPEGFVASTHLPQRLRAANNVSRHSVFHDGILYLLLRVKYGQRSLYRQTGAAVVKVLCRKYAESVKRRFLVLWHVMLYH